MTREELLDQAKEIVTKHRVTQYGEPEDSFACIAAFWSAYLGIQLASYQVAAMMVLLKVARSKASPTREDNWIDQAGYAACGVEVATRGASPASSLPAAHFSPTPAPVLESVSRTSSPDVSVGETEQEKRTRILEELKELNSKKADLSGSLKPHRWNNKILDRCIDCGVFRMHQSELCDPSKLAGKTSFCCDCGEEYFSSDLIAGWIYCPVCRKKPENEKTGPKEAPSPPPLHPPLPSFWLDRNDRLAVHYRSSGPGDMSLCGMMGSLYKTEKKEDVTCWGCAEVMRADPKKCTEPHHFETMT